MREIADSHEGVTLGYQWPGVNDHSPVFPLYVAKCHPCRWRGVWQNSPEEAIDEWRAHQKKEDS